MPNEPKAPGQSSSLWGGLLMGFFGVGAAAVIAAGDLLTGLAIAGTGAALWWLTKNWSRGFVVGGKVLNPLLILLGLASLGLSLVLSVGPNQTEAFLCGAVGGGLLTLAYMLAKPDSAAPPDIFQPEQPVSTPKSADESFAFDPARFKAARSAAPPRARSRFLELIEQNQVDIASDDEARAFAEALHRTMEAELDRDISHPDCPDDLRRFLIKVRDHLRRNRGAASASQAEIEQHPGYPGIEDQRSRKR